MNNFFERKQEMEIVLIHILSATLLLLIRGFVGLFAIIFVILMAIFLYRVHHSYWKDRNS